MGRKKPACPIPQPRAQTFRRAALGGGSSKPPPSGGADLIEVLNKKAFWGEFPWDEVNFFSRRRWIDWPAVGNQFYTVDRFPVAKGMVLALSGVLFRATVDLNDPAAGVPVDAYAEDDYFMLTQVAFFVSIAGKQIMDRNLINDAGPAAFSGWSELNRNIAPEGQKFVAFASEESQVECRAFVTNDPIANYPELTALGVEWHGVWIPISAYNALRKELR